MNIHKTILSVCTAVLLSASVNIFAQTAAAPKQAVQALTLSGGSNTVQVTGDLANGKKMELGWAEKSTVACFPGTRFEMFNGNHVLYRINMPARSRMTIELTPTEGTDINLYALRLAAGSKLVPPGIASAVSCEAKYPIYANKPGGGVVQNADDGKRKIEFISVGAPYTILIAAAGAKGLSQGEYSLNISVTAR